jgi:metallo-beta-lactamase family protein
MQYQFWGATETVTGSKTLVTHENKSVLIDCGLFQGYKKLRLKNWEALPFKPQDLEAVICTHAHLDHSGALPLLTQQGFKGKIYCTPGTAELLKVLLFDSAKIQEEDARYANKKGFSKHKPAKPLYTGDDVEEVMKRIQVIPFFKETEIINGLKVQLYPAGHIIGSSVVVLDDGRHRICFSGDLGRLSDDVMNPPHPLPDCDSLVLESTYGNRVHSREHPEKELAKMILETFDRGGEVLVPAFAVGRTQKVIYHIITLMNHGIIPKVPVYMDSPMGINASEIFCHYHKEHHLSSQSCELIFDKTILARSQQESMNIATTRNPKIVISSSGMATGGRVLHHLKRVLVDKRNSVIFTGFQAGGTRGAKLVAGEPTVKIHGDFIPVNASIHNVDSMSAHADSSELIAWVSAAKSKPKTIFLNHGEPSALESLRDKITQHFPNIKTIIPSEGSTAGESL